MPTASSPYLAHMGATRKDIMAHVTFVLDAASSIIYYLIQEAGWVIGS
ncbi:MAG: hypothetical protein ACE5H4_14600 [Candidatus Thorarchaeota archaeon]